MPPLYFLLLLCVLFLSLLCPTHSVEFDTELDVQLYEYMNDLQGLIPPYTGCPSLKSTSKDMVRVDMMRQLPRNLLKKYPKLAKKDFQYPIDDWILAYKADSHPKINIDEAGLPKEKDKLQPWVYEFCPEVVEYFTSVPYFTWFPTYHVPFPAVFTTEGAITSTCMLRLIDVAARRSNITWMLHAGTLLGAARGGALNIHHVYIYILYIYLHDS